jgi:hypothetical protein
MLGVARVLWPRHRNSTESSGKTTLALQVIGSAEVEASRHVDAEHARRCTRRSWRRYRKLLVSQPDNGEQALGSSRCWSAEWRRRGRGGLVAAPVPKAETKATWVKRRWPPSAADVAGAAERPARCRSQDPPIFINQLRNRRHVRQPRNHDGRAGASSTRRSAWTSAASRASRTATSRRRPHA